MAKSQIPEGKKRYQVTLTEDSVTRLHGVLARLNLPKSTMSTMLDEALTGMVGNMEKWLDKGNVTITDLFLAIGEQVEKLNEEAEREKFEGTKK